MLDQLILAFNHISVLETLENAPKLTVLDVHNNQLNALPPSVISLAELKTLNISNNNLGDVPPRLALLDNLVRIQLEGNPLKSLKASIRSAKAPQLKEYLRMRLDEAEEAAEEKRKAVALHMPGATSEIDHWDVLIREFMHNNALEVKGKKINYISEKIWVYEFLSRLDLSNNAIENIPPSIASMQHLKKIILDNNHIEELPLEIASMHWLTELSFLGNRLSGFFNDAPPSAITLPSLQYLNLSSNKIKTIPPTLKLLPSLGQLYLSHNELREVRELCRPTFKGITVLDLSNNKIEALPVALVHFMQSLNFVNLMNNELAKVPPLLGNHPKIKNLQLEGNPLKQIRRAVIEKGTEGVLSYLRDRYTEKDSEIEEFAKELAEETVIIAAATPAQAGRNQTLPEIEETKALPPPRQQHRHEEP